MASNGLQITNYRKSLFSQDNCYLERGLQMEETKIHRINTVEKKVLAWIWSLKKETQSHDKMLFYLMFNKM